MDFIRNAFVGNGRGRGVNLVTAVVRLQMSLDKWRCRIAVSVW